MVMHGSFGPPTAATRGHTCTLFSTRNSMYLSCSRSDNEPNVMTRLFSNFTALAIVTGDPNAVLAQCATVSAMGRRSVSHTGILPQAASPVACEGCVHEITSRVGRPETSKAPLAPADTHDAISAATQRRTPVIDHRVLFADAVMIDDDMSVVK